MDSKVGTVRTVGRLAATLVEHDTGRQFYAPMSEWGSVLRAGDPVHFFVDPNRWSGVHRVDRNTYRRFFAVSPVRLDA